LAAENTCAYCWFVVWHECFKRRFTSFQPFKSKVESLVRNNHPDTDLINALWTVFAVTLFTSTQSPTDGLADTASMYLKAEGVLNHKKGIIVNNDKIRS
jgi:hypothetical protein